MLAVDHLAGGLRWDELSAMLRVLMATGQAVGPSTAMRATCVDYFASSAGKPCFGFGCLILINYGRGADLIASSRKEHLLKGRRMSLSLDVVAQISGAVAAEQGPHVERITIASTSGEDDRVELLVTVAQYGYARRRLMLNLSRKEPAAFERQLRARLDEVRRQFPRP